MSKKPDKDSLKKGNLIKLLSTFSKSDIREFEKFVNSPYHNNRSETARYFLEIKKFHPGFDKPGFSKENIFSNLYPGIKYKDEVMRRLQSSLFKLGEAYIAHREFSENNFEYDKYILDYYYSNFIESLYSKQFKKINTLVESQKTRSSKYYRMQCLIEETNRLYNTMYDPTYKNLSLQKEMDSLLTYSLINLLRVNSFALMQAKQFNKIPDIKHLDRILDIAEGSGFMDSKAMEILWLGIKFETTNTNDETFYLLKEKLEKYSGLLERDECFRVYNCLLGYCYDMKIIPEKNFEKAEFELITRMLEAGIFFVEKTLYPEWFVYAFLSAVRAEEIDFAEKFIEEYKETLQGDDRENVLNHAYAELALIKKDYKTALHLLALPKYNSINEKLRANQMYIKIYFETGEHEQFFYQVNSFSQLIRNVTSLTKERGILPRINFIKYTSKLFRMRLGEVNVTAGELREEIMKSTILGNKWLLEKLDEYEKQIKR